MNEIPAVSQMLVTRRQKVKHFCCFYWKVTVFTVGFHCWTQTWRTYRWLCYRQNRNNLLSIPHTSWLFHTDHIFSHEWKMFHFILDPTYLFSGTFFYVRFYLFENGFSVSYSVYFFCICMYCWVSYSRVRILQMKPVRELWEKEQRSLQKYSWALCPATHWHTKRWLSADNAGVSCNLIIWSPAAGRILWQRRKRVLLENYENCFGTSFLLIVICWVLK